MKNILLQSIGSFALIILTSTVLADDTNHFSGKKIFEKNCASCHSGGLKGLLSGAPKVAKKSAWEEYLNKPKDKLYANIINGTKKHEPKGDCDTCSDNDIKSAIDYIVSVSK